jgi:hypothetical protein
VTANVPALSWLRLGTVPAGPRRVASDAPKSRELFIDAEAVAEAGGELQRAVFEPLHPARTEPWRQTVTRLLTGDGLIVGNTPLG